MGTLADVRNFSTILLEPDEWNESEKTWVDRETSERISKKSFGKVMADGEDGDPTALEVIFPTGYDNRAHFHTAAQFQVLLEGSVSFPTHELIAPAVHYADALSPYGPFICGEGFKMMVLRPWSADKHNMSERSTRGLRDPYGRNIYAQSRNIFGQADDSAWVRSDGPYDTQHLLGSASSDRLEEPLAELVRLDAGGTITNDPVVTEFGLFVIVLSGQLSVEGQTLEPYSMYFQRGLHGEPMVAGDEGATILRLAFDSTADLSKRIAV